MDAARKLVPLQPIRVERIAGPVLTAGAGDDKVWASRPSVESIEHRLAAHHFRYEHRGLVYEQAGHLIGLAMPYLPAPTTQIGDGGTRARYRRQGRPVAAHPRLLRRAGSAPPRLNHEGVTSAFTDLEIDRAGQNRGLWARRVVIAAVLRHRGARARRPLRPARDGVTGGEPGRAHDAHGAGHRARRAVLPVAGRDPRAARDRAPAARARPRLGRGHAGELDRARARERAEPRRARRAHLRQARARRRLRIWLQFEVNPTNVGHRSYGIELDDAAARVVRLSPTITVLP